MPLYTDRHHAGRRLADALGDQDRDPGAMILALVRGGVPVAYEVARAFGAPLDVFLVRKIGVPGHEELAAGAIASGDVEVINQEVAGALGLTREGLQGVVDRERRELRRREQVYRRGRDPADVRGRTAILVDDGIATGASMEAAVRALRQREPARVILAVPVAPPSARDRLAPLVDAFVCPEVRGNLPGVGAAYEDFTQVDDAQVIALLDRIRS
jgi:predicted phosphoribosyltransferase